jgi:hypothetical protein
VKSSTVKAVIEQSPVIKKAVQVVKCPVDALGNSFYLALTVNNPNLLT